MIIFFYNFSAKLKFVYLDLKNAYSNDNKYLAVVTENGLWIKDEIDTKIFIINAKRIEGNYLEVVSISEFNNEFELINLIMSDRVDISSQNWKILNPKISSNNITKETTGTYYLSTHFDKEKISTLFRNLSW